MDWLLQALLQGIGTGTLAHPFFHSANLYGTPRNSGCWGCEIDMALPSWGFHSGGWQMIQQAMGYAEAQWTVM